MPRVCALCLAAALLPVAASADEISTDRPDFVESSTVVGKGRFQLETSVAGVRDTSGGVQQRGTATPTLLRWGVSDELELRLQTDGSVRSTSTSTDTATGLRRSERGWADVSLGVKWHLRDGDRAAATPAMAWLLHADMATGSAPFRGQGVRPSLRLAAEWDLDDDVSVGVMPGLLFERNAAGQRYLAGVAAVTVSKGWGARVRTYAEVAGQHLASAANGGSVVTLDVGGTYLITPMLQIDLGLSFGANRYTPGFAWTSGVSIRF